MHIQEGTNTTLTTCTKMTEEVDRRHGVNGNSSSKAVSEDAPVHNSAVNATGGRLKFFKDGKFILELVRGSGGEGGRGGWVSVPRKTFWPPAAAPATPPAPPPASLSASDDNSSVHSSPWQRDQCWKQPAPRKNASRELALYYCRPSSLPAAAIAAESRARRRRPYLAPPPSPPRNGDAREDAADDERDTYYHVKLKKPYQPRKPRVYRKRRAAPRRGGLERAVRRLAARLPAPPACAQLASCRQEHAMVSPRKRILRELERVSLEDQGTKRRAKTAPALSTASYPPPSPGPSAPRREPPAPAPAPARHVSSYSIHSLLSMPDEAPRRSPECKRSPLSYPPSLKTESPGSAASPAPSPSPEGFRYRARDSPAPAPAPPPVPLAARGWAGAGAAYRRERDDWPAYYPYPYMAVYRAPPQPLWMQYAVPPAPSPWAPMALPLLTDHIPKDEPTSDLPLNLSKH